MKKNNKYWDISALSVALIMIFSVLYGITDSYFIKRLFGIADILAIFLLIYSIAMLIKTEKR